MTRGHLPQLVARLRAVPTPVVGLQIGHDGGSVTITADGARDLAGVLDGRYHDPNQDASEALRVALRHRGFDDVAITADGDNVRIGESTLQAARAIAHAVAIRR